MCSGPGTGQVMVPLPVPQAALHASCVGICGWEGGSKGREGDIQAGFMHLSGKGPRGNGSGHGWFGAGVLRQQAGGALGRHGWST
jgi:hypothetical protein